MNDGEPVYDANADVITDDVYSHALGCRVAFELLRYRRLHYSDQNDARGRKRPVRDVLGLIKRMPWREWIVAGYRDEEEDE